jgi:DNA polymerase-3 subunit gamma/tau
MFNIYFNEGSDIEQLADELLSFISKLLMIKNGIRETSLLEMDNKEIDKAALLIEAVDTADLLRMMNILGEFNSNKKAGVDPVVAIEIALTSLAGLDKTVDIGQLLSGMGGSGNPSKVASKQQPPSHKPQPPRQTGFNTQAADRPISRPSPPPQAPPPSQEHEAPTGPHKLAEIDKWWDNFLSFIRAKRPGLGSQLNQLKLNGAEGNSVIMGYDDNTQQLKNFLAKDKSSIIEYLTEFCGNDTTISFVKVRTDLGTKMENGQMNGTNGNSLDSARQFLNNHPLIKQVIDNVDGDVIGFRGSV